jgi:predicted lipid-binding transport protein (Tim44 family)
LLIVDIQVGRISGMGLIKNIFGAVFGLLGGIFKGVLGVFGIGKKSEYFLELDEATSNVQAAIAEAPKAAEKALSAAADKVNQAEKAAPAKPAAAKAAPATEKAKPAPAPVAKAEPAVTNFATEYLVGTSSNGRRRPGPSLSPFRDLARQVKVPAK